MSQHCTGFRRRVASRPVTSVWRRIHYWPAGAPRSGYDAPAGSAIRGLHQVTLVEGTDGVETIEAGGLLGSVKVAIRVPK